jgi:hypothetical protein
MTASIFTFSFLSAYECEIIPSCNEISSHIGDENTGSKKIKKNIDTPCKDVSCDELEFEDFDIEEWICFVILV